MEHVFTMVHYGKKGELKLLENTSYDASKQQKCIIHKITITASSASLQPPPILSSGIDFVIL